MKPLKHLEGNNSQSKSKPRKTLPKAKETNILSKEGGGNNLRMEGGGASTQARALHIF
ncbi:unnamed protein product [Prunus armeniaca]